MSDNKDLNQEFYKTKKDEKKDIVEKEFNEIDIDRSKTINYQELALYLDRKCNGTFDRQTLTTIYSKMDKDSNGEISINEFKRVWLEVDDNLNKKLNNLSNEIIEIEEKERILKEKRIIVEKQEQNKNFTELHIKINSVSGNKFNSSFVTVKINEESFETKKVDSKNPVFDEKKILKLSKDNKNKSLINIIKFKLIDTYNLNNVISYEFKLDDLEDQKIHNEYLQSNKESAKLNVELQWKHSDKLFIDMYLENWKNTKKQKIIEKNEVENNLRELHKPLNFINEVARNKFYFNSQIPTNSLGEGIKKENKFASTPPKPDHFFVPYTAYLGILLFFLCLLCQEYKYCYLLDSFISFFIFANYYIKYIDLKGEQLLIFSIVFFVSLVIDFVWIYIYTSLFWNSLYVDDGRFKNYRKFIIIMSYIIYVVKILFFLGLLGYIYIENQTINKRNINKSRNSKMNQELQPMKR